MRSGIKTTTLNYYLTETLIVFFSFSFIWLSSSWARNLNSSLQFKERTEWHMEGTTSICHSTLNKVLLIQSWRIWCKLSSIVKTRSHCDTLDKRFLYFQHILLMKLTQLKMSIYCFMNLWYYGFRKTKWSMKMMDEVFIIRVCRIHFVEGFTIWNAHHHFFPQIWSQQNNNEIVSRLRTKWWVNNLTFLDDTTKSKQPQPS